MLTAEASVEVAAPVSEVFAYMDDPHNQAEITPSISEVRDVRPLPNGGKRLAYTYRMAGVSLDGTLATTTYEPAERVVFELRDGPLSGHITWTFEPTDTGTRVTYSAAYELPSTVLETVVRPVATRYNQRQVERTLANLQTRVEAS